MCIISVIPTGATAPTESAFMYMWCQNWDGGGYMYADGNAVTIKKGFMDFDSFYYNFSRDYDERHEQTPFVTHFRITTDGANDKSMTHPFPLSSNPKRLKKTYTTARIGIAHNGIISLTAGEQSALSDTALYIKRYGWLFERDDERALDIIEESISGSRMAILRADYTYTLLGHWYERDGVYYSNRGYEPKATARKKQETAYNPYSWDLEPYDEYYLYNDGGYSDYWDTIDKLAIYGLTIDENGEITEL